MDSPRPFAQNETVADQALKRRLIRDELRFGLVRTPVSKPIDQSADR